MTDHPSTREAGETRKYIVRGPCYADGWWYVDDRNARVPEATRQWFRTRSAARAFAKGHDTKESAT